MMYLITGAIIKEQSILLVKKRGVWIVPGGKIQERETDEECLVREYREELSGTQIEIKGFYGKFLGKNIRRTDNVFNKVYFADIIGNLGLPSAEIEASGYFRDFQGVNLSEIASRITCSLRRDKYLPNY